MLTKSELLFERFLGQHSLDFERLPTAEEPRPDYFVKIGRSTIVFEVKELSSDESFRTEPNAVSSRTIGHHIRDKITKSRQQVKFGYTKGFPSVLIIYNDIDQMQLFGTEDHDFYAAMYGAHTVGIGLSSGTIVASFEGSGADFRENHKTYFSALARLSDQGGVARVTLFENRYAALPIDLSQLPPCFDVK